MSDLAKMNYWGLRSLVAKIVPRRRVLLPLATQDHEGAVRTKGRKRNYYQMDVLSGQMTKRERLLSADMASYLEVSCRAAECPMPFNLDVWDGLKCPFQCRYCYANYFRSSLYNSFFDKAAETGLRHNNPEAIITEIDAMLADRGGDTTFRRAFAMKIPLRFGIRFEDFLPIEGHKKISLRILQHLAKIGYPVMVNTKSALIGREDYVRALADNPAGTAVHITLLTTDLNLSKLLDVSSPPPAARLAAAKALASAGVRTVLRVEPFMVLVNDERSWVDDYIGQMKTAGVTHMTWDTYSFNASSSATAAAFEAMGLDFERMTDLTSNAQWLGSLMLSKMMDYYRQNGISCSTFDFGGVPANDHDVCCSVDGAFAPGRVGFNNGNVLTAVRLITKRGRLTWREFDAHVSSNGGWLTEEVRNAVRMAWNLDNTITAFSPKWVPGLQVRGEDAGDLIWGYNDSEPDFRFRLLQNMVENS